MQVFRGDSDQTDINWRGENNYAQKNDRSRLRISPDEQPLRYLIRT